MDVRDINIVVEGDLKVGNTAVVSATTIPVGVPVTFMSSDSATARILPYDRETCPCVSKCYLQCLAACEFTLNVSAGSIKKRLELTIAEEGGGGGDDPEPSPEKSLALNVDSLVLKLGETYTIKAITQPEGAPVTWKSTNPMVVSVTNGIANALSRGAARITASFDELRAHCFVEVGDIDVGGRYKIAVAQTFAVPVDIYPCNLPIFWKSDNPEIAKVNCRGEVTGVSLGEAVVSATVVTDTGPITNTTIIEVVEAFTPITELTDGDLDRLCLYCTEQELRMDNRDVTIKEEPEGPDVPRLFYVRTDDNPHIFNYKPCAIREDVERFLLRANR